MTGPDRRPGRPPFGVVLANLGSPEAPSAAAVRRYLREFLADPRVVDLPRWQWWPILHLIVLPLRPRRSARLYRRIWTPEGSPLLVASRRLGEALAARLASVAGAELPVAVGMRYGEPSLASALRRLDTAGCRRVLVLPLYPQYSATTTASVLDGVFDELKRRRRLPELRTVRSYHDHPAYLEAVAESVRSFWREHGPSERLVMSFHGLPERYVRLGDPYPLECAATARALAARLELPPGRWHMAYQSRFGREAWLRPDLGERLERWARRGSSGVDVVFPGFATDCLETLEEVGITGRARFAAAGGGELRLVPALNDRPEHAAALAEIALDHARGWLG
jgi:ferrochelatase